ncbi:MAG: hypothetical protein FHP92_06690 [Denitromonas halophila]|jgi:hypothetical protein|nr:MAG: hypothetical protein FHP94_10995 [Denitromonas halophila]TVT65608.1 MAG: hypothetical protein FHP93_19505 [Denitromonas halophila]TVT76940.1 MAG: hypothetical protein FHP92_06690 [Denitromonas halophila]
MNQTAQPSLDFELIADDEPDLSGLMLGQRLAIAGVLLYFVSSALTKTSLGAMALVALASFVFTLLGAIRLSGELGFSLPKRVLILLGFFVPLVNLVVLLGLNRRVTSALRDASYSVGLFGAYGDGVPKGFWLRVLLLFIALVALGKFIDSYGLHARVDGTPSLAALTADFNRETKAPRVLDDGVRLDGADVFGGDFRVRMTLLNFAGTALPPDRRIKIREVAAQNLCALPEKMRDVFTARKARFMYEMHNARGDMIAQILVSLDACAGHP